MSVVASQINGVSIVHSTVCSGADQSKRPSSAWLAFVRGINRWSVNSPHKAPVTRKCFHMMTSSCCNIMLYCDKALFMNITASMNFPSATFANAAIYTICVRVSVWGWVCAYIYIYMNIQVGICLVCHLRLHVSLLFPFIYRMYYLCVLGPMQLLLNFGNKLIPFSFFSLSLPLPICFT